MSQGLPKVAQLAQIQGVQKRQAGLNRVEANLAARRQAGYKTLPLQKIPQHQSSPRLVRKK